MEKSPLIKSGWLRLLLFVICLIGLMIGLSALTGSLPGTVSLTSPAGEQTPARSMLVNALISISVSFISVFFFRKIIDRKSVLSLGLNWKGNGNYAATGFFIALFLIGSSTLLLIANKNLEFSDITPNANALYIGLGLMILIAFAEELVFRGYLLNTMLPLTNKWIALGATSLIFAIFHGANPGMNALALTNVFLAGLILGINYIYTRNLWYGIFLHFAWNFYQGPVLGYKVSGLSLESVLQQELQGPTLVTGGDFGLEGSIIEGGILLLAFMALAWIYEKKFMISSKKILPADS